MGDNFERTQQLLNEGRLEEAHEEYERMVTMGWVPPLGLRERIDDAIRRASSQREQEKDVEHWLNAIARVAEANGQDSKELRVLLRRARIAAIGCFFLAIATIVAIILQGRSWEKSLTEETKRTDVAEARIKQAETRAADAEARAEAAEAKVAELRFLLDGDHDDVYLPDDLCPEGDHSTAPLHVLAATGCSTKQVVERCAGGTSTADSEAGWYIIAGCATAPKVLVRCQHDGAAYINCEFINE